MLKKGVIFVLYTVFMKRFLFVFCLVLVVLVGVYAGVGWRAGNLISESYILKVDVRADAGGFYVAFVTRVDDGQRYKMPVTDSGLVRGPYDGYVLDAGDVVQVEVGSIEESASDLPTLHPTAITVLRME